MQRFIFVILLLSVSCATVPSKPIASKDIDCSKPRLSEKQRDALLDAARGVKGKGVWTVLDSETLKFEGPMNDQSFQDYERAMSSIKELKTLILNSGGGNTRSGIKIGLSLAKIRPRVVVEGICASSCANYLYTSGSEKIIKEGWVGFHGNHQSTMSSMKERDLRSQFGQSNKQMSQADIDKQMTIVMADLNSDLQPEKEFLAKIGVSQEFFNMSGLPDKGTGLNENFDLLIPSEATQKKYGITHVTGGNDQDLCLVKGKKSLVYW